MMLRPSSSRFLNPVFKKCISQWRTISLLCPSCFFARNLSGLFQRQILKTQLLYTPSPYVTQILTKKTKKSDYVVEEESDSDEEFLQKEKEKTKGAKIMQLQVDNLRVDSIIKKSLDISRNRTEVLFYEGKIRINGKKPEKKNNEIDTCDEIDVIKEISPENSAYLYVSRVEILKLKPSGDYIIVTVRRQKKLMIENYEDDPWVESSSSEDKTAETSQ